jgi:hypothetical protein
MMVFPRFHVDDLHAAISQNCFFSSDWGISWYGIIESLTLEDMLEKDVLGRNMKDAHTSGGGGGGRRGCLYSQR